MASVKRHAVTVKDVPAQDFVKTYAAYLKRTAKIDLPAWHDIVKTATFKELSPYDQDWYYVRAASIARKVYLRPGTGVGALKEYYGGRKRNGSCRSHHKKAAGGIVRNLFKALAKIDVVETDAKGGRRITKHGRSELDRIAGRIAAKRRQQINAAAEVETTTEAATA